jgi:hypothetical protein
MLTRALRTGVPARWVASRRGVGGVRLGEPPLITHLGSTSAPAADTRRTIVDVTVRPLRSAGGLHRSVDLVDAYVGFRGMSVDYQP